MTTNDEINLLDIIRTIYRFFSKLFSLIFSSVKISVIWIISIFFKNFLIIILFFVLGLAGGYFKYHNSKPLYSADLILSSNYLPNDLCAEILGILQWHAEDHSVEILAKKLNMDTADAKKIVKLSFANYKELNKESENKDTFVLGLPFRISVVATDNNVFEVLQPALINYFDKNPNVIFQKNIRLTTTKLMINKIEKHIVELDSLKKEIAHNFAPSETQRGFVFVQPYDPLNIYKESINLYAEELGKNEELITMEKNINLIRDFEVRAKPYSPRLSTSLGLFGALGLALGFVIAYAKAIIKK